MSNITLNIPFKIYLKNPHINKERVLNRLEKSRNYPLLLIILELMGIEMRKDTHIKSITLPKITKTITSRIHEEKQQDNEYDRLSMFADDSSTIITSTKQVLSARENTSIYKKASC